MSNDKLEKLSRKIESMTLSAKKERLTAITLLHKSILALLAEGKPATSDAAADWFAYHPKAFTLSVTETYQMVNQAYERYVTEGS